MIGYWSRSEALVTSAKLTYAKAFDHEFSFGTEDVGHHDAKKAVQEIVQEQQETSQAICKARHVNHHPFEVEKQFWFQIIHKHRSHVQLLMLIPN